MDLENKKNETDFLTEEKKSENEKNERHFNNIESLNKIRNEITSNSNVEPASSNNFQSNSNSANDTITLTLDALTMKNMKFTATVVKILSILGIIATCISWKTKKDVESIIKNNNNSQIIGNNSSNNEQHIGDRG